MNKHMILKRPIVTEKATLLQDRYNKYVFEVDINANRVEVAHAVEKKFDVKVDTVRIMRVKGKKKTQMTRRGRTEGKKADWKKAIVSLKEGYKLDLFENV